MRGGGVSQGCTNGQDDSPDKKAASGIGPIVAVLLHVQLPTLPAGAGKPRWAARFRPGGPHGDSCHPARIDSTPTDLPSALEGAHPLIRALSCPRRVERVVCGECCQLRRPQ